MNEYQKMSEKLALIALGIVATCLMLILFASSANAQFKERTYSSSQKYNQRLQKDMSWETYRANYKKYMIDQARSAGKAKKSRNRNEKQSQRFHARIERLKK